MKSVRNALAILTFALLAIGYLASQFAYANDQAPEYAARVDRTEIARLALVLLVAAFIFMWVPNGREVPDRTT